MKIGVYVCHCGSNIAGTVDCEGVAQWAEELENVAVARDYKFMCSSLGQELIEEDINELAIEAGQPPIVMLANKILLDGLREKASDSPFAPRTMIGAGTLTLVW